MENGEKSFHKLFDILELIASHNEPQTVHGIAEELSLPESTVYRILKYLAKRNYIERTPQGIFLGSGCLHLGIMAQEQNVLQRVAHSELARLARDTLETAHLAKFHGNSIVYIDKCEGARNVRMGSMIGRNSPLYCTGIGKAMLAALPDKELEERLHSMKLTRFTDNTLCSINELKAELALTRERGYAIDNCEHEDGVFCIAAAVTDSRGKVTAGLSIAGMSVTMKNKVETLAAKVCETAKRISKRL